MIFSQDRNQLRKLFIDSWQKFQAREPLTAIEEQISRIIELHPEYHNQINMDNIDKDYSPEMGQINPFLHIGLHLAIIEQIQTNRPAGIASIYTKLLAKYNFDEHKVQHIMIDYLAEEMWKSQKYNALPEDKVYLDKLNQLLLKK
ncbi:uncharacterized protein DUF1841 [Allofrancisella inopinata]|uniref:DUF1841 family protein n=1 Tax=Allofrancisella inopinata TaxID=1085647 RepID=A0AAE6YJL0_9GAMM|nr:DUF1841 family protein [Allofrancisella inopinata]QIV95994.1 DUF1841 family protein [Allofrancisella inopinata]TDT74416.1 uncharacterized protein DUF1841 [Allofrancisella inopinata]